MNEPRRWFIGDGVIVRYSDDKERIIRVFTKFVQFARNEVACKYEVVLFTNGGNTEISSAERSDLVGALRLGQEWMP